MEKKKVALEFEEGKLIEKIKIKKSFHSRYMEEDEVYINKLGRFHCLNSMISDVNNSIKIMEKATNKLHH